ncbi:hypothetical protein ACI784_24755 [Geodermatophilus sp. SYSU D01186]
MRTTSHPAPTRRNGARITGSIGVVAAAAAVAGLGTFGAFTDSTTPVLTQVDTGVLSIALSEAAEEATVPFVSGGWVPGDRSQSVMDLVNDGTVAMSSVSLAVRATASSVLDGDVRDGLQLLLESCSSPWDAVGDSYTCAGEVDTFYAGPIVMDEELDGAASLASGGVDHLRATVTLPDSAGNGFQDASSAFELVFSGVQRDGVDR